MNVILNMRGLVDGKNGFIKVSKNLDDTDTHLKIIM